MRELRKETETFHSTHYNHSYFFLIRNERTPKGDGNELTIYLRISIIFWG